MLSVVLAVLGVVSGIVPFVSAARIISGMISGNREWSYYLVFVIAAFNALTENKTVIMIAHRLKTIRNADQIVVLDEGTVSNGTHEELLRSSDKYSRFIKLREEAAGWKMQSA